MCGLGRSGTTALARVLAAHPRVVLGIERYKRLWPADRIGELGPAHFTRERFFDFSDDLTNLTPQSSGVWAAHYARMAERFATARYVGDKITKLPLLALHAAFPDARFVCIVREAAQTAYSWQARAEDEADLGWPGDHDAERAVRRWNKSLRLLLEADTVIRGRCRSWSTTPSSGRTPTCGRRSTGWASTWTPPSGPSTPPRARTTTGCSRRRTAASTTESLTSSPSTPTTTPGAACST